MLNICRLGFYGGVLSPIRRQNTAKNKAEVYSTLGLYNRQPMQYIPMLVL
jgi:hypothetical protein